MKILNSAVSKRSGDQLLCFNVHTSYIINGIIPASRGLTKGNQDSQDLIPLPFTSCTAGKTRRLLQQGQRRNALYHCSTQINRSRPDMVKQYNHKKRIVIPFRLQHCPMTTALIDLQWISSLNGITIRTNILLTNPILLNICFIYLSDGETYFVPKGVRMIPLNLSLMRILRTNPLRTSFLPVHLFGSQCPSSHMASGHGNWNLGHVTSSDGPSPTAENQPHPRVKDQTPDTHKINTCVATIINKGYI